MTTGERIRQQRKALGLSAQDIAQSLGISRATVFRYECGDIEKIPGTLLEPLAKVLQVTPAFLMGWEELSAETAGELVEIRIVGEVAAGYDHYANEEYEYTHLPAEWLHYRAASEYVVLRVTGDSMYPEYQEGDQVLVHLQPTMDHSGQVGVFIYADGESTLKRIEYEQGQNWVDLVPINPMYKVKRISGVDLEQCRVFGKVVRLIRDYD